MKLLIRIFVPLAVLTGCVFGDIALAKWLFAQLPAMVEWLFWAKLGIAFGIFWLTAGIVVMFVGLSTIITNALTE